MHITFCHNETDYLCDAQSIFLQRLMPELKELGHEPRLILISPRNPDVCALPKVCSKYKIPFDSTYSRGSIGNNIRWCLQKVKKNPPEVFVPHHCYWALYAAKWLRSAGIPSLGVLHSDDEPTKKIIHFFGDVKSPFVLDGFIAVSQAIADQVALVNPNIPVFVIPCGVPIPQQLVTPPVADLKVAYFGRIIQEQKRIIDVAKAFLYVVQNVPKVTCHIWGNGESEPDVRKLLSSQAVGDRVVLYPAIPVTEVYKRMSEYHVIVLLSDYEGTPTSLMEGMANGLVPIVTDIGGGVAELVTNNVNGLVVEDRLGDFCNVISRLNREPDTWKVLSRNAANHIKLNYSIKVTASKWVAFAFETIKRRESRNRIQVPGSIDIDKKWRIQGPNYYSRCFDYLAGAFAIGRFVLGRRI